MASSFYDMMRRLFLKRVSVEKIAFLAMTGVMLCIGISKTRNIRRCLVVVGGLRRRGDGGILLSVRVDVVYKVMCRRKEGERVVGLRSHKLEAEWVVQWR